MKTETDVNVQLDGLGSSVTRVSIVDWIFYSYNCALCINSFVSGT